MKVCTCRHTCECQNRLARKISLLTTSKFHLLSLTCNSTRRLTNEECSKYLFTFKTCTCHSFYELMASAIGMFSPAKAVFCQRRFNPFVKLSSKTFQMAYARLYSKTAYYFAVTQSYECSRLIFKANWFRNDFNAGNLFINFSIQRFSGI